MSSVASLKSKKSKKSKSSHKKEINVNNLDNEIKIIKRTLKNNTHLVLEDTRLKSISSWRKSHKKFTQNFIFNFLSFGILHLISLYYPQLYIKLYCNPWPPKECDFFLVENIYGEVTLCTKKYNAQKFTKNIKIPKISIIIIRIHKLIYLLLILIIIIK